MADGSTADEKALAWARQALEKAVEEVSLRGLIESPLVESRPAWARPFEVVIGQLRDQGRSEEFFWVIGGSVPVDCLHSGVAATPRDAARHFSMKWQLEAARQEDPRERSRLGLDPSVDWEARSRTLVTKAEYLYAMVEDERLWS